MTERRPIGNIVLREDLYPRESLNHEIVQRYAVDVSVLPPLEVNQDDVLIDGRHRWTAHKNAGSKEVECIVTETASDAELLELSIERNAKHGHQLSTNDKKRMARRIYHETPQEDRGGKKERLATLLSVGASTVASWLSRIDKDQREERQAAVLNLHLQCFTQEEIAKRVGMPRTTVEGLLTEFPNLEIPSIAGLHSEGAPAESAPQKAHESFEQERLLKIASENRENAFHVSDFKVPIYNVWKQQTKSEGAEHFGNSEVTWVDRLLYLYTKPFDIVVDPFAGGGSTLDICKKRFRRCWISDRKPIEERAHEIREADASSLPDLRKRWKDVKLVYLDPPYWKQAAGEYSDDADDLANMSLDDFTRTLAAVIKAYASKLTSAYIALIISPTQWRAPEKQFTDHVGDMLRAIKLPVDMRFSVPYESQQYNGQMVEWAKENKRCLVLSREIVVWRAS